MIDDDPVLLPKEMVMKNPIIARKTPNICVLVSLSFNIKCAKNNTIVISRAPAMRPSFEAPILLAASYHVKIPIDKNIAAGNNSLKFLKIVFLKIFIIIILLLSLSFLLLFLFDVK
jgi:hypothetical protein